MIQTATCNLLLMAMRRGLDSLFENMSDSKTFFGALLLVVIFVAYKMYYSVEGVENSEKGKITESLIDDSTDFTIFTKEKTIQLIKNGDIEGCLKRLGHLKPTKEDDHKDLENQIILLMNRWNMLITIWNKNMMTYEQFKVDKSKIADAVLYLIEGLNQELFENNS